MSVKQTNPVKVIRAYCLYCGNGQSAEVKDCEIVKCPLHEWRFGKNPFITKRVMTGVEREKARERMLKVRTQTVELRKTAKNEAIEQGGN